MESCTAAFATEDACGEIKIQKLKALDFVTTFIDLLADLLSKSKQPEITVGLFDMPEGGGLTVTIVPLDISDVVAVESKKTFLFRLDLRTSSTVIVESFTEILHMVKICSSILEHIKIKQGLTIVQKLSIISNNVSSLALTISKTT